MIYNQLIFCIADADEELDGQTALLSASGQPTSAPFGTAVNCSGPVRWNLDKAVWPTLGIGTGAKIALIDTGVNIFHPELDGHVVECCSFVDGEHAWLDDRKTSHGTAVASILCGRHVGVAPGAALYVAKVVDNGGKGLVAQLVKAINWAVEHQVDVISLSVGTKFCAEKLLIAVSNALSKRIHVVCAASNEGSRGSVNVMYPARFGHTLCIGGSDDNGAHLASSSIGREIDLLAPGENIGCAFGVSQYAMATGTSMAVPLVSGLIAMLVSHLRRENQPALHASR